jgi:hypothetical protein
VTQSIPEVTLPLAEGGDPASVPTLGALLRGDPLILAAWIERKDLQPLLFCLFTIISGASLYGAAMGLWRAPVQGLYVAIKLPLIMLLTTFGNGLLNAMLAPLLGVNLRLRQSFLAILLGFAISSAILGAFSPVAAFLVWNAPGISTGGDSAYGAIQLMHVAIIAFAGITANLHLARLLRHLSGNRIVAARVLFAWLAGNLFFGSQLSWILRPFIGSPGLEIDFLRRTAFQGNFYETVFYDFLRLFHSHSP